MSRPTTFGSTPQPRRIRRAQGFTLIELLVVIGVIGIMAAILLPALNKAKEQGKATACRNNMKQIALGFLTYAEDNEEFLPWPGGQPDRAVTSRQYESDWCYGGRTPWTRNSPRLGKSRDLDLIRNAAPFSRMC